MQIDIHARTHLDSRSTACVCDKTMNTLYNIFHFFNH